jgi:hypothetical protein
MPPTYQTKAARILSVRVETVNIEYEYGVTALAFYIESIKKKRKFKFLKFLLLCDEVC